MVSVRTRVGLSAASVGLALLVGTVPAVADQAAEIAAVKAATEKYQDINVALAEGYIAPDNHCAVAAEEGLPAEMGAMGIHYIHPGMLGITATAPRVDGTSTYTDWSRPAILMYEPQADGSMKLVGAENLVFQKAWEEAGNTAPPSFAGRTWDHMADDPATPGDEAHGFEPHYDQHVWFVGDPEHALLPFNPAVSCEHAAHQGH